MASACTDRRRPAARDRDVALGELLHTKRSMFGRLVTAMLAFGVGGLVLGCGLAHAQPRGDTVYTIANYPVEAQAQDAVTAKERALADGQQAAFRSLLKRLVPVTAYGRLKALHAVKAADLVEGVSVRSERNSTTQYIASLDFAFSPQAVRALLRQEGIALVDQQATRTVLVPIIRSAKGVEAGDSTDSKLWSDAWSGLDLEHTLTPVRLGTPRAPLSADVVKKLIAGDAAGIGPLAAEFRSDYTVVALAEPDSTSRRLHVWLLGSDASGPILLKRSYRLSGGDLAYSMELAAVVGLGILEGRWKAQSVRGRGGLAALSRTAATFEISVEFRSRVQWEEMRGRLDRIQDVEDVEVLSLTTRSATLAMRFPGGPEQLADAVETQGMTLSRSGGGWSLRPMP